MAEDVIPMIAQRYGVSVEAVRQVERALRATGGSQAQFDHPDLGGLGHWMPGMVTVERMGDHQLKVRVEGLCAEVAAVVRGLESAGAAALSRDPGTGASSGRSDLPAGESWWPAGFGHPASAGTQHGIRYAYFPERRRLLVQMAGRIDCYDTGELRISGAAQSQRGGSPASISFTSDRGDVALSDLTCMPLCDA